MVNGEGVEVEKNNNTGEEREIYLAKGECVFIPRNTYHVFLAITDCESVSFLTKRWDDCDDPIIHENLGFGKGNNFGFRQINSKYALALSPDTILD